MSSNSTFFYDPNDLDSYYPYHPSIGANMFFLITFYMFGLVFLYQMFTTRKWYVSVMAVFALCEGGGYTARTLFAMAGQNVYDKFLAQIIILILSPNFAQAYMYTETAELIKWADFHDFSLL